MLPLELNEGKKYCRMLPSLSDNWSLKPILVFFLSGCLRQVLLHGPIIMFAINGVCMWMPRYLMTRFGFLSFLQNKQDTEETWENSRPNFDKIQGLLWSATSKPKILTKNACFFSL